MIFFYASIMLNIQNLTDKYSDFYLWSKSKKLFKFFIEINCKKIK